MGEAGGWGGGGGVGGRGVGAGGGREGEGGGVSRGGGGGGRGGGKTDQRDRRGAPRDPIETIFDIVVAEGGHRTDAVYS